MPYQDNSGFAYVGAFFSKGSSCNLEISPVVPPRLRSPLHEAARPDFRPMSPFPTRRPDLQQQDAAVAEMDRQAAEQDFIAQQQKENAKMQQMQEEQAREAARAQKAALANAKRQGVKIAPDATGAETIQRHPDGQPVYEAGFVGQPQISDKGGSVAYRDARGQRYDVPFDAIRSEPDPTGETFYSFDVTGPDGQKQTMRQPAGTKPLFRVDPGTGSRIVDVTDPATGSVQPRVVGVDPLVANKAAIEKRKNAAQLAQNERSGTAEELRLQLAQKDTLLQPVRQKLREAQEAADKLAKEKSTYEQAADGYYAVTSLGDGVEPMRRKVDSPQEIAKADAWVKNRAATEKALMEAKAAHDPAAAEIQAMQERRDALALETLKENRRAQAEIRRMEEAAKAGQDVTKPDWQQRAESLTRDAKLDDLAAVADLETAGDPLAPDVQRAAMPDAAASINRMMSGMLNNGLDLLNAGLGVGSKSTLERAIADSPTMTQRTGKPATTDEARRIAAKSLGITDPASVEVTPNPLGHLELRYGNDEFASYEPDRNRITIMQTAGGLHERAADLIAKADKDGVPVYLSNTYPNKAEQPFTAAELRDLLVQGVDAVKTADSPESAEAALAQAGLAPNDIRGMVRSGKLSVQDGRMMLDKFHGVEAVNYSRPAIEQELGRVLATSKTAKADWEAGNKAAVINRVLDGVASKATSGVVVDRGILEQRRQELLSQHVKEGAASKVGGFLKELIMPMIGIGGQAVAYVPQKLAKWTGYETEAGRLSEQQFTDWQKRTGSFVNKMMSRDDVTGSLMELRSWAKTANPGDSPPDDLADKIAGVAYDGYHELTDDAAKALNTSRDTFNVNRDPMLRAALDRYLRTADPAAFDQLSSLLMLDGQDRKTQAEVSAYISAPRVASFGDVIGRAKGLNIDLTPDAAGKLVGISRVLARTDDPKAQQKLIADAGKIMGLEGQEAAETLVRLTADETDDPDSAFGLLKGGFIAGRQELLTEVASTAAEAGLAWVTAGAATPEIIAERAARQGIKTGIRAAIRRNAQAAFAKLADSSTAFAKTAAALGKARQTVGTGLANMGEAFAKAGIKPATFGQPLTRADKVRNAVVQVGKNAAAAAPMEALEEGVAAIGEPDPNAASIGEQMLMGAAGGLVLTPMFAGAAAVGQAWKNRGAGLEWEAKKTGYIEELNRRMESVPGFKPLTVADFDAWQGLQDNPAQAQARQTMLDAMRGHEAAVTEWFNANAGNPQAPLSPAVLAAQANVERAGKELELATSSAFMAMDELRGIPEAERPLYTAAAKAATGARDFTEAEAKALMAQGGNNAVVFQQAQVMPADVAGPPAQRGIAAPAVSTVAPGVYRLPAGVRVDVPPALLDSLVQKAPTMVDLLRQPANQTPAVQAVVAKTDAKKQAMPKAPKGKKAKPATTNAPTPTPTKQDAGPLPVGTGNATGTPAKQPANPTPAPVAPTVKKGDWIVDGSGFTGPVIDFANGVPVMGLEGENEGDVQPQMAQGGWEVVDQGGVKPAPQRKPAGKTLPAKAIEKVTREAIGRIAAKSPRIKALLKESKKANRYPTGGMWLEPDGTVMYHVPTIVKQLESIGVTDNATAGKRVEALLDEEIRHSANMEAARRLFAGEQAAGRVLRGMSFETWRDAWYGDIWNSHFTDAMRQAVQEAYGDTLPEADWMRAMEGLRMLDQLRATGSITEAVLLALDAILESLREFLDLVTAGGKKVVEAEIMAIREVLAEYGYEGGTVKPDAKKKPAKPKAQKPEAPKTPKSSTQLTLSPADAKPILDFGATIPKDELFDSIDPEWSDGALETEPHVTVLYGLTKHEAAPVAKVIKDHGPITITLGKLSVFENDQYDVLKVDVESPELRALNAKLSKLPHESSFPDYKPHMTIAYLKKGEGKKYVGDARFEGQTITFNTMTFSPPSELRGKLGKPELPLTPSQAIPPATTQTADVQDQTKAQGQRQTQEVLNPVPETAPRESELSNPDMGSAGAVDGLPPIEKAPPGSPDLAAPTIAADKHWLFDTQAGDVAGMTEGRNVFIVAHFTKLKDAKDALAKINQGKDGPARIEAWLAKPKKEGGKVVSKWAVFIPNVTQDFVDEFNAIKAKDQAANAPKQAPLPAPEIATLRNALRQLRRWKQDEGFGSGYEQAIDNYERGTWTLQDSRPPAETLAALEAAVTSARQFWIVQNTQYIDAKNAELVRALAGNAAVADVMRNPRNDAQNLRIYLSDRIKEALVNDLRAKLDSDPRFGLFYDFTQGRIADNAWLDMMVARVKEQLGAPAASQPSFKVGDRVQANEGTGKIAELRGGQAKLTLDNGTMSLWIPVDRLQAAAPVSTPAAQVPGAVAEAYQSQPGDNYPYPWKGVAYTNEGGRLAVDRGGPDEQTAKQLALELLAQEWNARESRRQASAAQAAKKPAEPSREEWQKTYAKFKRALSRAVKAKDYAEIIRQADAFQKHYEADGNGGFPDDWSTWERHKADAEMQLARQGSATNPLVVPILKPVTPPRPAERADDAYANAQAATRAALGGLFSAPVRRAIPQLEVPRERFDAIRTAAEAILEANIRTPEAFARFMDDTFPGGKARPYSEAIWDMLGIVDKSLRGSHDWTRIYGDIEQPLPDVQEPAIDETPAIPQTTTDDAGTLVQRPDGAESGNADSTGNPRAESPLDSGRVGSGEPGPSPAMGAGENLDPASQGGPGAADERGGASPNGRNEPPERSGDSGAIRDHDEPPALTNYVITKADALGSGSIERKFDDNLAAIELLKRLEAESRQPTRQEQAVLVRYVGWGGMKQAFNANAKGWGQRYERLKAALTPAEYDAAMRSTMDAHYTSDTIIQNGIWGAMKRFGFSGGKMLEGGVGIGHMIGLMPADIRPATSYMGIEKDSITARIAGKLYPEARILEMGFEKAAVEVGHFDGAVGNPPFGNQSLYDPQFKDLSKFSIHNYFIAKHLEAMRPGAVAAFVVSHYFLDALDPMAREHIAKKAQFLGAIRLPNNAFQQNANTKVTTDIVYFARTEDGAQNTTDWITSTKKRDPEGNEYSLNEWIERRPDMILGEMTTDHGLRAIELVVKPRPGQNLAEELAGAVAKLPENVYRQAGEASAAFEAREPMDIPDVPVGGFFVDSKGVLQKRLRDVNMERQSAPLDDLPEATAERIKGMVAIREAFNRLVSAELQDAAPSEMEAHRSALNAAYDAFVKKHGFLNQQANRRAFYPDPQSARILGLEQDFNPGISRATAKKKGVDEIKPSARKADIFTKRVNVPFVEITQVQTAKEALTASLNQRGLVDVPYMQQISGMPVEDLLSDLEGLVFEHPNGGYEVKEKYLSGNVRRKLQEAREAATINPRFEANVKALEAVQPPDLTPSQVSVTPGAPFVPAEIIKDFAESLIGSRPQVTMFVPSNGGWVYQHYTEGNAAATQEWGTTDADFGVLFQNILNSKPTVIYDKVDDKQVVNVKATELARSKENAIKDKWRSWIWEDVERADRLLQLYNDIYNVYVDPKYDGSHLTLPGMSSLVNLRPHQKNVVWRILNDLQVLLDHVVGAGKTFAGIAAFMELRRVGRVRKPLFAVPNHLVTQWRDDFLKLYPNANVLFARPSDFAKDKRQLLFAKIMSGEYDAVIVGHSSLKKIGMSPEVETKMLNEMLAEITSTMSALAEAEGRTGTRAQTNLQRQKETIEGKLARLADKVDSGGRDAVANFEELGIDALFVDEAHEFKNLFYTTQMTRVAGLGNAAGSGKAFDLYLKTRYLRQRYANKAPIVFATGTPISNSLVEMFTMQRYLQPQELDRMEIATFDAWAKVYGQIEQVEEVDPTGTSYRTSTRLAKFQNAGDLAMNYRTFADVITMTDLKAQAEAQTGPDGKPGRFPVPKVKGGRPQNLIVPRTPEQAAYYGVETERTTSDGEPVLDSEGMPMFDYPEGSINWRVDNMPDDPRQDNMLKLTNDARKAALDMRLINPSAPDRPNSKVNVAAKNILQIAKEWEADRGTQLVFCDLSIPSSARGKAKAKAQAAMQQVSWRFIQGRIELVEKATPVEFAGFADFSFFVHKSAMGWSVVERSSGGRVGGGSTKADAIQVSAATLARMGMDRFRQAVEQNQPDADKLAEFLAAQEEANPPADSDESDTAEEASVESVSVDELLAEQSSFSVYDDLRAKLVAGGMKEEEVAFIHDYDTPEKKAKLFAQVNRGEVRVLIGSTAKLGAGTNVQRRLVALHHLDAPWRPSDLEQREGRIIRQGNEFFERDPDGFEVRALRYATKLTYDTRMWQIIEHKAAGIEGFRKADRTTRVIEDVSGEAANAADMKAAASGDPRIQREISLRGELTKLRNLRDAFNDNRQALARKVSYLADAPKRYESTRLNLEALIAQRDQNTPEEFQYLTPSGKRIDKKEDTLEVIVNLMKAAKNGDDVTLGRYRGFIVLGEKVTRRGNDFLFVYMLPIGQSRRDAFQVANYGPGDSLSGVGFIQRLDNKLQSFEGQLDAAKREMEAAERERLDLEPQLAKGFTKTDELERITAEHEAVKAELRGSRRRVEDDGNTEPTALLSAPAPTMPSDRAEAIVRNLTPKEQAGKLNPKERVALEEARARLAQDDNGSDSSGNVPRQPTGPRSGGPMRSLWRIPDQAISSADTSINQGQLPASFKRIAWQKGTVNADIGGGRFDNATDMLAGLGVENVIYDPFNRSQEHNRAAVAKIAGGKADTATVNNVLNVIQEPASRSLVIQQAADAVGADGTAYFLIYEGDGSGQGKVTTKGWQENRKAESYAAEVGQVFGSVVRKGNLLIATQAKPLSEAPLASAPVSQSQTLRQPQITAQNAWALMLAPSAKSGIATDYIDGLKVSLANANTLAADRAVSTAIRQKARQDAEQLQTLIPEEEAAWQRIRQQYTPQQLKQIHDDATAYTVPVSELQADLDNLLADFPDAATRPAWATAQIESLQSEISGGTLASSPARKPNRATQAMRDIIEALPPPHREVLRDLLVNGMSIEDAATTHNISETAVGNILRRGEAHIRLMLDRAPTKPTVQVQDGIVKATDGRPDLAMSGNAAVAAVDQRRMTPEEVTHAEMQELATRLFDVAPAEAESLVVRWMDSGTTVLSTDGMPDNIKAIVADAQARNAAEMMMTAAAKMLVARKTLEGGNSTQLARLIYLYRNTGTEQARALGMRRDPFDTPEERAAMYLSEALLTPPDAIKNELRRNPANRDRILAAWAKRADEIKAEMLAHGIDLDATFADHAEEQKLVEETIPEPVKPALARAPKKTRQLVKAIMQGMTPAEAIRAAGLTAKVAFRAYQEFRASLNQTGTEAAKAMRDQLLRSAPAPGADFAANLGLPDLTEAEWLDAVQNNKPLRKTPETEKLKQHREKAKKAGTLDLKNSNSTRKAIRAIEERKSNAFEKISEFWRASILSGPQTHVVNLVSGLTYGAYEASFKKLAAGVQGDIARMFGAKPDAASLADIPAMIAASLPSIKLAFLDGIAAWKSETRAFENYALQLRDDNGELFKEQFNPALKGTLGKVMRGISFRLMGAADEFVKSFFTRIEVAAQARQIARNEGKTGHELAKAIQELMEPGSLAWERALGQAKKITFQTEIGSGSAAIDAIDGLAQLISRTKKGDFGKPLKGLAHFTFPFVDTPTNIFKAGVTMSPAGGFLALVDMIRAYNRYRKGNAEEAAKIYNAARALDDLTNQIVAWGFILGLSHLVKPGDDEDETPFITGTIPWRSTSPGERELAYRTAPPQSIRIGDRWISYKRLDPFASALAFTVDSIKEFQSGKPIDEVWGRIALGMGRNMQDKTFLQGISDVVNAVQDPERFGTKWATNIATGFVPNLIRQPIRTADEVFRETDLPNDLGFWDALGRRMGYGIYPQGAMPAITVWGEPARKDTGTGGPNTDWMLRLLSPADMRAANVDMLDVALLRYNATHQDGDPRALFGVTAPSRELQRTIGGQVIKISLDDAEYEDFITKAGKAARQAIGTTYEGRDLTEADVDRIKDILSRAHETFRNAAFVQAVQKRGGLNALANTTK